MKKTAKIFTCLALCWSTLALSVDLNTGPWRFELRTLHGSIPFIVSIQKNKNKLTGTLYNGRETIKLSSLSLNDNKLSIPLQTYEMSLEMKIENKNLMRGNLVRHNKDPKISTPVIAIFGEAVRFPVKKYKPDLNLTGRWAVTLTEDDKKSQGVLVFEQNNNDLYGSLLTPTGDYRFFEGYISGSGFEVASFDGVYNYLISGSVKNGKLTASLRANYKIDMTGTKDDNAQLPDPYSQTKLKSLNFQFPDLDGKMISLRDEKFKNKPVIIQFFGSWCPNCMDETNFLIPWYKNNKQRGIEVIALAFERSLNEREAKIQLRKVQKKKRIPYTLLIAGSTAEDKPVDKVKNLENFISFPTTVFLNKKHEVVKVHAGFTGPGTGQFYETWKSEFTQTVGELLK